MKDFYTSLEISERMGIGQRQVAKLAKQGHLPCIRRGRLLRFPVSAWQRFIEEQAAAALSGMKEATQNVSAT